MYGGDARPGLARRRDAPLDFTEGERRDKLRRVLSLGDATVTRSIP